MQECVQMNLGEEFESEYPTQGEGAPEEEPESDTQQELFEVQIQLV